MQFPINIALHRSRLLARGLLSLGLLLVLVILSFPRSTGVQAGISLFAIVLLWLAWRQLTPGIVALRLEADGTIAARLAGARGLTTQSGKSVEWLPLRCLPAATVHPWLTALKLQHDDGRQWSLVLLADSAEHDAYRRLRVFLRWQLAPGMYGSRAAVSDP